MAVYFLTLDSIFTLGYCRYFLELFVAGDIVLKQAFPAAIRETASPSALAHGAGERSVQLVTKVAMLNQVIVIAT